MSAVIYSTPVLHLLHTCAWGCIVALWWGRHYGSGVVDWIQAILYVGAALCHLVGLWTGYKDCRAWVVSQVRGVA
jgi:hypothetical protein